MRKVLFIILSLFVVSCSLDEISKSGDVENVATQSGSVALTESGSSEPEIYNYINEKYNFKANLLPGFTNTEYFPDDAGVVMSKIAKGEVQVKNQMVPDEYNVEIGILVMPNYGDFSELNDYVMDKFPDYSKQFSENGIYVDERSGMDAIRHYFVMTKNGKNIIEVYLKVLGVHFPIHQAGFDAFTETIKLL